MRNISWSCTLFVVVVSLCTAAVAQQKPDDVERWGRDIGLYGVRDRIAGPRGLLFGPSGELFVAEQSGGSVVKIDRDGRVTRVARGLSKPHDAPSMRGQPVRGGQRRESRRADRCRPAR